VASGEHYRDHEYHADDEPLVDWLGVVEKVAVDVRERDHARRRSAHQRRGRVRRRCPLHRARPPPAALLPGPTAAAARARAVAAARRGRSEEGGEGEGSPGRQARSAWPRRVLCLPGLAWCGWLGWGRGKAEGGEGLTVVSVNSIDFRVRFFASVFFFLPFDLI